MIDIYFKLSKTFVILINLLVISLIFSLPILADKGEKITVEGYANIKEDITKAKDEAVLDAIRRGVEQVLGSYIDSRTIVQNYELIEDSVLSQTRGYVSEYSIKNEKKKDGILTLKVEMVVKEKNIEDDLQALQLSIQQRGNPRVAVVVAAGEDQVQKSVVEDEITKKLVDSGFEVVNKNIYDKQEQLTILNEILQGKQEYASQLGAWFDTTYLVIGSVDYVFIGEYEGLLTYKSQVQVDILNSELANIISTHRAEHKETHVKEEIAREKAAAASGQELAPSVLKKLAEEVSSADHTIRVVIASCDFSQKEFFQQRLQAIRLTEKVYLRGYKDNTLTFDVVTSLPADNFAEALVWWDMDLNIHQVSSNVVKTRLVP